MGFSAYVSRMTLVHLGPVIGCSFLCTDLGCHPQQQYVEGSGGSKPTKFHATATLDRQSNSISGFDTAFCRGMLPVSLAKKKDVQYFSHEQIEVRQQVTIMKWLVLLEDLDACFMKFWQHVVKAVTVDSQCVNHCEPILHALMPTFVE